MNKTALGIITVGLIIGLGIVFFGGKDGTRIPVDGVVKNSVIRDGIQYVTITARGGYSPEVSEAQPGIPTKLIMKTKGTYDCSSSLIIRSLNVQKILPQTGETEIDIGVPVAGVPLLGTCSMGMYNFRIDFK